MPAYDYRCRTCDSTFELRRSLSGPAQPAAVVCPQGHRETTRVFSAVAVGGRASSGGRGEPVPAASGSGRSTASGCCGGGCCG